MKKTSSRIRIREIARLAEVSAGSVDRALHGRKEINKQTREKILAIAQNLGYEPNWAARALKTGHGSFCVGVCIPKEIHFFYDQVRDGILEEAGRFRQLGVEILYQPLPEFGVGEGKTFRALVSKGVHAIILAPRDPAKLAACIDAAEKEHNIRVVCVATDVSASCRSTVISTPPKLTGALAGELMAKFVAPGSRVAVVTGMLETETHAQNTSGFLETFSQECGDGTRAQVIEDHQHEEESRRKLSDLLGRFPDLAGIYVNTANSLPVCRVVKESGRSGQVKLITSDIFPEMTPYLQDRTISASIYQQPYQQGHEAIRLLLEYFLHGKTLPQTWYLQPSIVMLSNLRLFREFRDSATEDQAGAISAD